MKIRAARTAPTTSTGRHRFWLTCAPTARSSPATRHEPDAGRHIRGISPGPWQPVTTMTDPSPHDIPDLVEHRLDRGVLNAPRGSPSCSWPPR